MFQFQDISLACCKKSAQYIHLILQKSEMSRRQWSAIFLYSAFIWLKYCRYGVKHNPINQSYCYTNVKINRWSRKNITQILEANMNENLFLILLKFFLIFRLLLEIFLHYLHIHYSRVHLTFLDHPINMRTLISINSSAADKNYIELSRHGLSITQTKFKIPCSFKTSYLNYFFF